MPSKKSKLQGGIKLCSLLHAKQVINLKPNIKVINLLEIENVNEEVSASKSGENP